MSGMSDTARCRRTITTAPSFVASAVLLAAATFGATQSAVAQKSTEGVFGEKQTEAGFIDQAELHQQINQDMSLSDSDLVTIQPAQRPGEPFMVQFVHDDQLYTLDAIPWSVRSEAYQLLVQVESGELVSEQPGDVLTFRGQVLEIPGSDAAGSYQEDGLWAMILKPDGERLWIEPAWRADANALGTDLHVVYSDRQVMDMPRTCGTLHDEIPTEPSGGGIGGDRGGACGTGLCFAELGNDADTEYFTDWGSVANVENRINSVVAAMNVQYENDVDITHVITAIIVRTSEPDPYSSTNSGTLVNQVQQEWTTNQAGIPHDIAQLFTGKEISGSTIGEADSIGGVCTSVSYSYSQSDCCGSFARTVELHAHENGHVWNGFHCDFGGLPPCPGNTMATPLNNNPLGAFSAANISRIVSHRNSRTCLAGTGGLTPPFFDDFDSGIENDKWSINDGATTNSDGNGEPSPPNSLNIDGDDVLTSNFIDLNPDVPPGPAVRLTYWWQRTGSGNSPESGEDLFIEYFSDSGSWETIAQYPGEGPDGDPFQFAEHFLPADARHAGFRLRIRGTSPNTGADDWFIDDLLLEEVITPEDNDVCGVNVITVSSGVPKSFDTMFAQTEGPTESLCGGGQIENDIWYRYVADCESEVSLSICDADFDARLAVYQSCPTGSNQALACDDSSCPSGEAELTFTAFPTFVYWIRIGSTNPGEFGTGTLNIECVVDDPTGACCMPDGMCNVDTEDNCISGGGAYQGDGTDCGGVSCPQPCVADIADDQGPGSDGTVNLFDLLLLLDNWGTSNAGADISSEGGGSSVVDLFDLLDMIDAWGDC